MKHIYVIFALLLLVGCNSDLVSDGDTLLNASGQVFHATIEGSDADSRVYLDSKLRIMWNSNDMITVFEGKTRNKKYQYFGDDGENSADFEDVTTGFGSGNKIDCNIALYPYASTTKYVYGDDEGVADYVRYTLPTAQTYAEGSIGLGANVMVAVTSDTSDTDLMFRNVCSFLRVKLYGTDQTVSSVVFEGNSGEAIAGNVAITPVYDGVPTFRMLGSATSITLNCTEGVEIGATKEAATEFWLVVPALNFAGGFTITVNGYYGGSQQFVIPNNLTFARNTYNTVTRELSIVGSGTGMGVDGWGDGGTTEGSAE